LSEAPGFSHLEPLSLFWLKNRDSSHSE